ncbi:hypothetical protein HID58_081816 [Brassica napus]|uniref:Uncharacterized protein n=1 Tax=Brassica napus TaxID=3708 RepID=A0ABQ7Y8S0_BRANA|nr:hypothetical protein HID58_081816 [Brassica napus]
MPMILLIDIGRTLQNLLFHLPSTPRYVSGDYSPRINARPVTAPVTIPSSSTFDRNPLPPFSPRSTRRSTSSQVSFPGIAFYKSSRSGDSPSGFMNQYPGHKCLADVVLWTSVFKWLTKIRVFEEPDKSLDRRKTSSSISQSLPIGRKSQDAAVGVLVQMLKTAPPLRQDSSTYMASMYGVEREGSESGTESEFSMARSTSDALEELINYKQLKDLLLSKSKSVGGATPVH